MSIDIVDLREFYISQLGRTVRKFLRHRLRCLWPSLGGEKILAVGYAAPLLRPLLEEAERLLVMMPAEQGVAYWPKEGPNMACLVSLQDLPLEDESVDRVIMLHSLETAPEPETLLHEVWRVLKGNGRVLVIVPNRRGLWAHCDSTPFGTGRPYSAPQLKEALREQGFLVERIQHSLFLPPLETRLVLLLSGVMEKTGYWLLPGFGGVLIAEASKQIYAPMLAKAHTGRNRIVFPLPFPVPSGSAPAGLSHELGFHIFMR